VDVQVWAEKYVGEIGESELVGGRLAGGAVGAVVCSKVSAV
jgi:hypothetical protein